MPDGLTNELWNNITFLDSLNWFTGFGSRLGSRIMNTPIFKEIVTMFDNKISNSGKLPLKWLMLSAHDSNVAMVMTGMNFTDY